MAQRVAFINLGCPKNLVDSEVMLGHLQARGFELSADPRAADVVVVNTCGFLEASSQESVNTLLSLAQLKTEDGPLRAVVAAGCMTQRFSGDIAEALPEVDGFLGVGQAHELPDVVEQVLAGRRVSQIRGPSAGFEGYGLRLQSTPGHTAYLKISEGCDRTCAFCIIPKIRGSMQSRTVDQLVEEAEVLVRRGVRELILVGQDPTRYGVDLPDGGHRMVELLERLNQIPDLRWIRLMYLFPDRHVKPILEAVARLPKVCKYVDMPLQHVSRSVLRAMRRPGDGGEYLEMIRNLRSACPDVSLRSTFVVGFPGETAADFAELEQFLPQAELDWVGVFEFSPEAEAEATALPGQVPNRVARKRKNRLMELQQQVTEGRLRRWLGRTVECVVESVNSRSGAGPSGSGRTSGQAPDVDGEIHVSFSRLPEVRVGDFVAVEVEAVGGYDLQGRAVRMVEPRAEFPTTPGIRGLPTLIQISPGAPLLAGA